MDLANRQSHEESCGNKSYLLFRGDCGLPIGMLPISPYARRLLWQGYTLSEALINCKGQVDSLYWQPFSLRRFFLEFTETNRFDNPFVSTTDNIRTALSYATQQFTSDQGYISIIKATENRCTKFRDYIDVPSTQLESEFGLDGVVLPDELLFQVPVKDIEINFYLSDTLTNNDAVSHFMSTYATPRYAFKHIDKISISCPNCGNSISEYLCEVLGSDSNALRLFILPQRKSPQKANGSIFTIEGLTQASIDNLAVHGMIVCCPDCKSYICLPEKLNSRPLEIIEQIYDKKKVSLKMKNLSKEWISFIALRATYFENGEDKEEILVRDLKFDSEDLRLTAVFGLSIVHTVLTKLSYRLEKFVYESANRKFGGGIIQPGEEATHIFDLDYEPASKQNYKLTIYHLRFLSGKTWISPEDIQDYSISPRSNY